MTDSNDPRRTRRMALRSISSAFFRDVRVSLVDVSTSGVGIRHDSELKPGETGNLEFTFDGARVALPCTVVYCDADGSGRRFRSGLAIQPDVNTRLSEFIRRLSRWANEAAADTSQGASTR